ncbi:hypothetical protein E1264_18370 [Actinomadura sp. KC216]|uniref:DUF6879 family protein n=1 Tax=Actinomadura sp. KC216 TaxID=2530370 RepID=UPI001053F22E|nr:DUF6879 family protein [Actinomadura sp. KC216]TDB86261.1 hypothetical protein E1264_18370 [Actinomadura sp. KC216]
MVAPTPVEFVAAAKRSARRLEMRDGYMTSDPWYQAWQAGKFEEYAEPSAWPDLIREVTGRGVQVQRARVVSEPVSDYIRFEHATTAGIVAAGERVRWLPRPRAARLALPGTDCWIVDGDRVLFSHYTGDGEVAGRELVTDPDTARLCVDAFSAVWELGTDHEAYRV